MNIGQGRPERPYQSGRAGAIGQRRTEIVTNLFVRRWKVCANKAGNARQCHSWLSLDPPRTTPGTIIHDQGLSRQ